MASKRRVRELARVACALLALSMLSACSALVAFDGLTGGSQGAGADGGADADASAPTSLDATMMTDGARALDAADGSDVPFCASFATAPSFCDDFERDGGGVQGGWTQLSTGGPGAEVVLGSDTAGHYEHAEVAFGGLASRYADLGLDLPLSTSKLTVRWRMRVQANTASDMYSEIVSVASAGVGQSYRQILFSAQGANDSMFLAGSALPDGGNGPGFSAATTAFQRGQWNDLLLVVDFAGKSAALSVNGVAGMPEAVPDISMPTDLTIRFGVNYIGTNGSDIAALAVDVDDVAISY